jgi:tetratricopeptide (TPR) repeat protein
MAWGLEHTSTLSTVNNLGALYADLGRLDEAEKMCQRALDGYAEVVSPDNLMTNVLALNNMWALASLRESRGRVEDARHWYSQALRGHEMTFGPDHDKCESLRSSLASLISRGGGQSSFASTTLAEDYSERENIAESIASLTKLTWDQHRLNTNCKALAEADT